MIRGSQSRHMRGDSRYMRGYSHHMRGDSHHMKSDQKERYLHAQLERPPPPPSHLEVARPPVGVVRRRLRPVGRAPLRAERRF